MLLNDYPIEIKVVANYQDVESEPHDNYFLFNYHITIYNNGDHAVTLLSRHWIITDGDGHKREVRGSGVVGEQPRIGSGESYTYSSRTNFATPIGSMYGKYTMQLDTGELIYIPIAPFRLAAPGVLN